MRKLIIQIPCLNEAATLPVTLASLPRSVPGFDSVEWLVIDDGSTDDTAAVARQNGADHVLRHNTNLGLASAFMTGLEQSLRLGADVIVNTDADNQYDARDIPKLVAPVLDGTAQIVVGARPIDDIEHFSPLKRRLQKFGSSVMRLASNTAIDDAPSGMRAIHREAALRLFVFNDYTYTLETIIQGGRSNIPMASVPIRTNPELRQSRLVKSLPSYLYRSVKTILRVYLVYRPLRAFGGFAAVLASLATALGIRYLYFFAIGEGDGHLQSLLLMAVLYTFAGLALMAGLIGDLIAANRRLLQDIRFRVFKDSLERGVNSDAQVRAIGEAAIRAEQRRRAETSAQR